MKELFRGYYRLSDDEFEQLWKNAAIIFDTNVLLNLYRYQSSTRTALLGVIKKLSKRVWIPHHVGLEFQRNRLKVISEQYNRFTQVRTLVDEAIQNIQKEMDKLQLKTKHSHIDPDPLIEEIENAKAGYFKKLAESEKKSISTSSQDPIREEIDELFNNKIGRSFKNQKELDDLYKDGEQRYQNRIPPGFKDVSKEAKEEDCYTYSGLLYHKKFGDLIIWKQLINHAKESGLKDIIFITDDNKSDWWLELNGKTIGARPELVNEIGSEAGVERFHIYSTQGFLEYANKHLGTKVKEDAIDEIREVVATRNSIVHGIGPSGVFNAMRSAERAVYEWLLRIHSHIESGRGFPDFIARENELKIGYEIKFIRDPRMLVHRFEDIIYRSYISIEKEEFDEINLILVTPTIDMINDIMMQLEKRIPPLHKKLMSGKSGRIKITVGYGVGIGAEGFIHGFEPCARIEL